MDKAKRKVLINEYRLSFPPMGIFSIRNKLTEKRLIGQSANLNGALNRHRLELRLGTHRNPALMSDWHLLGEAEFSFEILEQIKCRVEPDFDYSAELDRCMAVWRVRVPVGSPTSYL
jgi:hypothetical protein